MTDNNELDNYENLHEKLQGLKNQEGIVGYILRGSNSAAIDLKDPKKIIDYAVLSSGILEVSSKIAETFQVGEVETVVLEGDETKLLSMKIDEKVLSIFMEKTVDHNKVCTELK
jgi:predicted regulator of Ras-like GTPase activity (Roadblock/LC7/MglB family)